MHNHASFNCFSQADLIGQQHARRISLQGLHGDVDLVRQHADSGPHETTYRRLSQLVAMLEYIAAQREPPLSIDQTCEQSVSRRPEL